MSLFDEYEDIIIQSYDVQPYVDFIFKAIDHLSKHLYKNINDLRLAWDNSAVDYMNQNKEYLHKNDKNEFINEPLWISYDNNKLLTIIYEKTSNKIHIAYARIIGLLTVYQIIFKFDIVKVSRLNIRNEIEYYEFHAYDTRDVFLAKGDHTLLSHYVDSAIKSSL